MLMRLRPSLRLIAADDSARMHAAPPPTKKLNPSPVANVVHRFAESIGGRPYLIEAALVSHERWRAYIVRIPGVPTALMPFYGRTPDEAARQLTDWLSRAHQRAAGSAAS
jgi:hypothetical protein